MKRCPTLLLLGSLTVVGVGSASEKLPPAALPVTVDILPGESANLVDPQAPDPVAVAVLGTAELDVTTLQPESLHLGGAPIVKDADGTTHQLRDVDGDGRLDLVVQFAAYQIQLSDADGTASLEGTTTGGLPVRGRDRLETVVAALARGPVHTDAEEKLSPIPISVALLHAREVALLGSDVFDAATIPISSIRLNGRRVTRGGDGELASVSDVDGDGRDDLIVTAPREVLQGDRLLVNAATRSGRLASGETLVMEPLPTAASKPAAEANPADKARYPYVIFINDNAPAQQYPATLQVSGASGVVAKVRVTLNGILHTCFNDLDILLVAPSGQSVVLMSDVGGCGAPLNATYLTFDDAAPSALSAASSPAAQGSYRPMNDGVGDSFPAPAPSPSQALGLSAFQGTDPNGEWKLYVVDDKVGDTGQIREGWSLDLVTTTQICNPSPLTIPDSGAASLYPSTITVSGMPPNIVKATVTLNGLSHTFADDLDVLLTAPGTPTPVMLMSDAGGAAPLSGLQLTFDDDADPFLPDAAVSIFSAPYRPSTYEAGDVLPPPAPGTTPSSRLRSLRGTSPNGTWSLYVSDDAGGDQGTLAGGWCLNVTAITVAETCQPFPLMIPEGAPGVTSGPAFPYPLYLNVRGASGIPTRAQVRLLGLSHTFPDDLDVLLVTPFGRNLWLMSDVGGGPDVTGLDVTFDTAGSVSVPDSGPLGPGPYRPTDFEPGESLPSPAPAGPYPTGPFPVTPANGDWKLYVNDDAGGDVGEIAEGFCLDLQLDAPGTYCSSGPLALVPNDPMTIPNGAPGNTAGPAYPYGSRVYVPEEGTVPRKIRVQISNLTHTFPGDIDMLLVGPRGQKVMLMSDAGGGADVTNLSMVFDDDAATGLPDNTALSPGEFRPTDYISVDNDAFPAPAPPGPYGTLLSAFAGQDPQGYWDLYVLDDASQDVGSLQSWCIEILPVYPAGEVPNLRWESKTALAWDAATNATGYWVMRGTSAELPNLVSVASDGCLVGPTTAQSGAGVIAQPAPGELFWYLVMGYVPQSPMGPAGSARIGGASTARTVSSNGVVCNPP